MRELFYPRAIVVVGVSENLLNVGRWVVNNLISSGFAGPVHAVGQRGGVINGQQIFTSVLDVPRPVDLAAIVVPAAVVPSALEQCGQIGVKWAVIMSSGFSEVSSEKRDLENAMLSISKRYGLNLIGPNCVGILNTRNHLAAFFAPLPIKDLAEGPVSIMAQSGSVALETSVTLSRHRVGVGKFVSLGNKLDTDEAELLKYLVEDDADTRQIAIYLEGIVDGRGLFEQARRSEKPIVLYKANIVPGGSIAAKSHTAALASDDAVVEAMCRQANIVRARSFNQFVDFSKVLSLPPMRGNNVGIVSVSGGAGVVLTDYCYLHGFNLPEIPQSVLKDIEGRARTQAIRRGNPLDLGDSYDRGLVVHSAEAFLRLPEVDGLLLCLAFDPDMQLIGPPAEEVSRRLLELSRSTQKPLVISFSPKMYPVDVVRGQMELPIFNQPEEAVEALAASRDYWRRRNRGSTSLPTLSVNRDDVRRIIDEARAAGRTDLGDQALEVLRAYGLDVEAPHPASTAQEAVAIARRIGYPVAMKIRSPQISHKSDVGGVALGLTSDRAVTSAFRRITRSAKAHRPEATILGVTVQKMVTGGKEVIIGSKWDEQFGPVVMFGLGGVLVELLGDVSFRLAPLTLEDAREMIDEVRTSKLLRGFRGEKPADVEAVIDALLRVSRLVGDFPEIAEVDVNPLKVFESGAGCRAVDARLFLRSISTVTTPEQSQEAAQAGSGQPGSDGSCT